LAKRKSQPGFSEDEGGKRSNPGPGRRVVWGRRGGAKKKDDDRGGVAQGARICGAETRRLPNSVLVVEGRNGAAVPGAQLN